MKMLSNRLAVLAAGAVVLCGAGLAPITPAFAVDKPTNSKAAAKPLKAAKDSLDAKRYQDAIAKLKDVQNIQGRNAYDDHLINEMLGYAYTRTNQYPEAAKALEADLDSSYVTPAEQAKKVRQLFQIYYQLKNYDKVLSLGERSIKGGYADDDIYTLMGQAYYLKNDFKNAAKFLDSYIGNLVRAGKKPKEQTLVLQQNSCTRIDDHGCEQRTLERLVSYYPKAQYWQSLVSAMYKDQSSSNEQQTLQVYRLASAVDVLSRPSDYTEYAQLAIEAGSPGEAQTVLEKGFEKKIFTEQRDIDRNKRLLESAKKQVAQSQANLQKADADAAAGKTGDKDITVGLAYLGYQQYDKAAAAIQRGLAKPGVANPADAQLSLGIAQLGAGRKDEARKAFKAVKGNPTLERLANLWTLHAQA